MANNGLLNLVSNAVSSYQDRSSKLEEMAQREKEREEDKKNRDLVTQIALQKEGLINDPVKGLVPNPNGRRSLENQKWAVEQHGKGLLVDFDENGSPIDKGWDPEYLKRKADEKNADPFGTKALTAEVARANLREKQAGTKDEREASEYANRLEQSEGVFSDLVNKGYNRADIKESAKGLIANVVPSVKTKELGMQQQAEDNFLNAKLRKESGAAISDSERTGGERQYFPRPGDTPEVLAQKAANRAQVIQDLKNTAGPAYKPGKIIKSAPPPPQTKVINGVTYKKVPGGWEEL